MKICPSCGGVLGRDCFNPNECAWIGEQEEQQAAHDQEQATRTLEERVIDLEERLLRLEAITPTAS